MSEISKYGMPIEGLNEHKTESESDSESREREVEEKPSKLRNSLEEDSRNNFPDRLIDLEGNVRDNLSD